MSNNSSNKLNVPQAKQGMEQFKMQAANEVGINLKNGGGRRPRQGPDGQKFCPVGRAKYDRHNRIAPGHVQAVEYIAMVTI